MRGAHVAPRRGIERFLAILTSFAVFTSLMVMFAPAALAHHPEISAGQTCVDQKVRIQYQAISWKTDGTPGSGHSDIRIEVRVDGAGSWVQVDSGAFNAANNYRFSDTFDAEPYWGSSIEVRARAVGPWDNGMGGGETRVTSPFLVSEDCFNPSCPDQYYEHKVEPVSAGVHGTYFTVSNILNGNAGPTFDWSSTRPVFQVIVKGGPGANIYDYPGGDTADTGLHAPLNPNNGKWYGLSHITFCYGDPATEPVEVTANPQVCQVIQGVPQGAISFDIDPASGATVQVYSDAAFTIPVGGALGNGQSLPLAPGTYFWQGTAASGHSLNGSGSGGFTIAPCSASTVVVSGECAINSNGAPMGSVQVSIDPSSGATVVVTGPGGPYNFSGSGGSQELAPGDYSWMATAGAGFELTGDTTGDFTIEPCDAAVVVAHGQCEVLDGPHGSVTVFIDVESGATVNVYDGELELAAQFVGTGGSSQLAPGTYTWQAIPGEGFEFPEGQSTSGEFTIDPCVSTVIVTHGNCIEGASTAFGSVTVEIDPAAAATVSILNSGAQVVATFTGPGGSQSLVAGAYYWVTAAVEGYTVAGDGSGSFTVAACPDEVEGEEIVPDEVEELVVLPFTGLSTEALLGAATVLLGTGWVLIRTARRREEG